MNIMKILVFINQYQYQDENLANLLSEMSERSMQFEILDITKKDHRDKFELYGIMQTPAIVVSLDDGKPLNVWEKQLPRVDQISTSAGLV